MLGQTEPPGHGCGRGDGTDGADFVGDVTVFVQGLGEALQPVETVRVLLGHHDRADARLAFDQPFRTEQIQCLADGVAGDAVVVADRALQRQHAAGEAAGAHLVAQQVGELPRLVRAQPPPACGSEGHGVLTGTFGWHAPDHTDAASAVVLPECCAMNRPPGHPADLR